MAAFFGHAECIRDMVDKNYMKELYAGSLAVGCDLELRECDRIRTEYEFLRVEVYSIPVACVKQVACLE